MSDRPAHSYSSLWNDLPKEERFRLMPYQIELQIRHVLQCKEKAIAAHKRHMRELDDWIKNMEEHLKRIERNAK